jgi:steroid delta-isomerase-like uncharacterized protein
MDAPIDRTGKGAAMSDGLRQHYLDYLAALNEHRFDDLVHFVADDLTYNDRPTTRAQYQSDRQREAETIQDLRYDVGLLVVEGDFVAAKLDFDCTPTQPFLGFAPTGKAIRFSEHVFYRFADGRIAAVTSLLDLGAIQRALGAGADLDPRE